MTTVETPRSSRSVVVTVAAVVEETSDARSLVFDVPDEWRPEFAYKPGQFLTLRIPSDRTGSVARCYSLASSPFTDALPKVTIKRTAGGYGSHWLCDNVGVGDRIEVLPPAGVFTPASLDEDLILFAAGSGITPVMSILKSALSEGGGKVVLVYANRDETSIIFADELRGLAARHEDRLTVVHWLESVQGLPTPRQLVTLSDRFRHHRAYLCGPRPFMDAIHEALALAGVPRDRVHAEVFTSLSGDPFAEVAVEELPDTGEASTVEVGLDGEAHNLSWPRTATLVDVMLSKGLDVPYSCREGECGSCACTVVEGEVDMDNASILDPEDIASGYILACQARPVSGHVRIEF
ncbi:MULTISPECIES: ferredoxin--NADP reductase [unclassified Rhodococcus (in: high G+C Gram-positive bacteria)]|uniref:ferredoxin--NADP reductase n=1 Tax=unclassified Rhodococcus (in: high G+C Gram-positive bacteria) TaxID=192944 RepID=UPI00163A0618|nr:MULTISPECIES: ferredoxin--NADP reductase [unclassified Rhodococcus (in: high G+C Gram-positive bacteria)]MBC2643061.1 ferredoxin--NADP reductase [Rhodococcus sp. 3A]MBC2892197.1 ferredoxin--NADP reductase [Rhodococcus sp. 4CII]